MDKSAKIYVAGHRGLVGSAIWRALETQDYNNLIGKSSAKVDLTDQEATEAFFAAEQPEYVFLAAARVGGIAANNTYRADFIFDNLAIQNNVIGASFRHKVKKLLFLGSSCIYPKEAPQPIAEDSLLSGPLEYTNEPYAIAKIAGIKLIESFNLQHGTNYLAVMPTNLYGRNDNFDLEKSHVMPALIRKTFLAKLLEDSELAKIAANLGVKEDQVLDQLAKYGITKNSAQVTLKVWGSGKPKREFLHVDDMAAACVFVMNQVNFVDLIQPRASSHEPRDKQKLLTTHGSRLTTTNEIRNTHLNIGTGSDITIKELAELIKQLVGFKGELTFDPSKPDGTMRKLLSVAKLKELGWHHTIELKDGLAQTIKWYENNMLKPMVRTSYLDTRQGDGEQRTEVYEDSTPKEQSQPATQSGAKSTSGAAGSAGRQAGAVRRSGNA